MRDYGSTIEFDLITAKLDKKLSDYEKIGNVNVYRVGRGWILDKYFYPFLAYRKAKKLHKGKKYSIVNAIMANYSGIAALFFKWKYPDVKYLLNMQSGDSDFFIWLRTWFWYPIYKMVYTKADFIQPISKWLAERAVRYGYKGEMKVVPNGVDLEEFRMQNADCRMQIADLRKQLGIREDDKVVITVSRLVEKNGVDDLIKGVKGIVGATPRGCPKCKLLIVGTGKLKNKLENLVDKLKLEKQVIFLGHIDHDDLPKYLWASDIFCRPSLSEGLGISFLEAMAAGLPVIATPVGGIPDFLEDGETGVFCKVRNPKSIADAVSRLLNDKELYDKIAENGLRLVEEKYDWERISLQMKNIYEKLYKNSNNKR